MRKLLFLFVLISSFANAQYSIKGTINPADKYSWVLVYKLEGAKQVFVKNVQIEKQNNNGTFKIDMPDNADKGVYRLTYDMRKNGYLDVLYNHENIEVTFNPTDAERTATYKVSKENVLYKNFLSDITRAQYQLDSLQISYLQGPTKATEEAYKKAHKNITAVQNKYMKNATGTLAYHFIKATDRYNAPQVAKNSQEYLKGVIGHFFDNIDFSNKALYNSSFLVDRVADYVFYMHYSDDAEEQVKLHKQASDNALKQISNITLKADVIEFLIAQFASIKNTDLVDYLFTNHFDKLPIDKQNQEFKKQTLASIAIAINKKAPNFSWEEKGIMQSLHNLNDGEQYLLVFYSTGCPHCLKEVPQVFEFLKDKNKTSVVAFAMETSDATWKNYVKGFPGWHHVLGLNKWENETARTYQINATPTYFVLGKDKKIIATPNNLIELKKVLVKLN